MEIGHSFEMSVAEQRRRNGGLPRRHPIDVAAQRVDLAVVRDHTVRMRKLPHGNVFVEKR